MKNLGEANRKQIQRIIDYSDAQECNDAHNNGIEAEMRVGGVLRAGVEHKGFFYYVGRATQGYKRIKLESKGVR